MVNIKNDKKSCCSPFNTIIFTFFNNIPYFLYFFLCLPFLQTFCFLQQFFYKFPFPLICIFLLLYCDKHNNNANYNNYQKYPNKCYTSVRPSFCVYLLYDVFFYISPYFSPALNTTMVSLPDFILFLLFTIKRKIHKNLSYCHFLINNHW